MKPVLVVDCYVEGDGAKNFRRLLGGSSMEVWRPVDEPVIPDLERYTAMLISGSAACVTDPLPWMETLVQTIQCARDEGLPVLGICFGHQIVAHALFGEGSVRKAKVPEIGWKRIEISSEEGLLTGVGDSLTTFASHFDEVRPGISGMRVLARSKDCAVQVYKVHGHPIWGIQFHAEMDQREAEELAVIRIEGRPDLGLDVTQTVAASRDSTHLAKRLFHNFLSGV